MESAGGERDGARAVEMIAQARQQAMSAAFPGEPSPPHVHPVRFPVSTSPPARHHPRAQSSVKAAVRTQTRTLSQRPTGASFPSHRAPERPFLVSMHEIQ